MELVDPKLLKPSRHSKKQMGYSLTGSYLVKRELYWLVLPIKNQRRRKIFANKTLQDKQLR